ncbi:hypothetical protein OG923_06850 [Streptomyces halstedii]|uniref:hypothetical protein n=2 Tax=Streptomyces TaxID=1883 RepID=UPI003247224E
MYEHLKAGEAEAGPVPSTPAVLVERAPKRQPVQDSLKSAVPSPELLAEMRRCIVAQSYR